jgi:hypothetical protein
LLVLRATQHMKVEYSFVLENIDLEHTFIVAYLAGISNNMHRTLFNSFAFINGEKLFLIIFRSIGSIMPLAFVESRCTSSMLRCVLCCGVAYCSVGFGDCVCVGSGAPVAAALIYWYECQ